MAHAGFASCRSLALSLHALSGAVMDARADVFRMIVVGTDNDPRYLVEILLRRRRSRLPLQPGCLPWIIACGLSVPDRPCEINQREHVGGQQNQRTDRRHDMVDLKFWRIDMVATRHARIAHDELRQEGRVESKEHRDGGEPRPRLRIHSPGNFGHQVWRPAKKGVTLST